MHELASYSPDYPSARGRFRQQVQEKGGTLHALPVNERQGLYIDIGVWAGTSDSLILHSTGLHGVEAFPGSAVQCAFLKAFTPDQLAGQSLVLIHCINPFGMQYLRRWNSNNVDLNRNFLSQFANLPANPLYQQLNPLLNPTQVFQLVGLPFKIGRLLSRHRFSHLQQAVAQGQYDYPEGLFFGGNQPATETELLLQFFQEHLGGYTRIRGIDFHTGLGKFGQSSFYLEADFDADDHQHIEALLDTPVIYVRPGQKHSYQTQGGFIACLRQLYQSQDFLMTTQEIGTVGPLKIIKALREENFCYHYVLDQQPEAGLALKQAFCPDKETWQVSAVQAGVRGLFRLIHASRPW